MPSGENQCQRCGKRCVKALCWHCGKRGSRKAWTLPFRKPKDRRHEQLGAELNGIVLGSGRGTVQEEDAERARREAIYTAYVERHGRLDCQAALAEAEGQEEEAAMGVLTLTLNRANVVTVGGYRLLSAGDAYGPRLRIEGGEGRPLLMRVHAGRTYELGAGFTVTVARLRSCGQIDVRITAPPEVEIRRHGRQEARPTEGKEATDVPAA